MYQKMCDSNSGGNEFIAAEAGSADDELSPRSFADAAGPWLSGPLRLPFENPSCLCAHAIAADVGLTVVPL